jgi:two-component system sensor histidine kinase TtrS
LAERGEQITLARWSSTADYLMRHIPQARFRIKPLPFESIEPAIYAKQIDFLLANSGIYIKAEHDFGAFRIATLITKEGEYTLNRYGGVIFTRRNNPSLNRFSDLKGTTFAAVNPTSLGGFLMAKRELKEKGIEMEKDLDIRFFNTHDAVVNAVLNAQVNAGTVRSDTLEWMSESGLIQLEEIKVINPQGVDGFPYRLSTRLYPEWPMAALPHTSKSLDEKVAIALLKMPENDPAAIDSHIFGWTVPANYESVHELYRVLNISPHYKGLPTLSEWTRYHPIAAALTLVSTVIILISLIVLSRYNQRLRLTQHNLSQTIEKLQATEIQLKQNLSRLRESENKFSQLAKAALDAIIMLDPKGNIEFWNPAATDIFGYSREVAQRMPITQWLNIAEEGKYPQSNSILNYIGNADDPMPGILLELEGVRSSGEIFPIEAAISSVSLQNGWHVICLIRDVTLRKQLEAEREQLSLECTQHHKMAALAQLAEGIAHEINTPIQTIKNNLAFLQEAFQDSWELISTFQVLCDELEHSMNYVDKLEACKDKCDEIDLDSLDQEVSITIKQSMQDTDRVSRIIRSMRIFTSNSTVYEKTDLNKLIDTIIDITRYQWESVAELKVELADNLPMVACSPSEIHQALINILMNAVQALGESPKQVRGEITIHTQRLGQAVQITIRDNGNGIPEEVQGKIFDPFFTTREVGKGTGQGLTLSHDIVVRKHGGNLDFMTETGVGTTFYLRLPIDS